MQTFQVYVVRTDAELDSLVRAANSGGECGLETRAVRTWWSNRYRATICLTSIDGVRKSRVVRGGIRTPCWIRV